MLRKLSFLIALTTIVCAGVNAQNQSPELKEQAERKIQRMVFDLPSDASYLGVQTKEISKENMAQYNLRKVRGVAIEKVSENSPAAQAGLQNGDVIVRFNGEEVSSVRKLIRLIGEVAPDHQARITISRGGNEREITATIGKQSLPKFEDGGILDKWYGLPGIPEYPNRTLSPNLENFPLDIDKNVFVLRGGANRQIGVSITSLTKQLSEFFGIADGKGLLISEVRENSPAAKAGLKAGDVIVEIDDKQVGETAELLRGLSEKKEGDVTLTVVRNKNRQTFRVTPETLKRGNNSFKEYENFSTQNLN